MYKRQARNGEPFGEIGLVNQQDAAWGAQHGAPRDPQPGNTKAQRDVRISAGQHVIGWTGPAVSSSSAGATISSGSGAISSTGATTISPAPQSAPTTLAPLQALVRALRLLALR